jgi:hypothetical protein
MEDGSGTWLVNPYAINRQIEHRESPHLPDLFHSMGLSSRLDTGFRDAKNQIQALDRTQPGLPMTC